MTRCVLLLFLLAFSQATLAASSAQCLAQTIWHEARGESLVAQKAVWQVVHNRSRIFGKTICQVVREKGQFPWAKRLRSWKLSEEQLTGLFRVINMKPVLGNNYLFFNRKKHKWGKQSVRIGHLWFSK